MSWLPSTGGAGADPQTAVNTADIATIEGEQTTQDSAISANTAKISYTDAAAVSANSAKVSYSDAALVATHTTDIGTNAADIATNVTAIALNTAKTGITAGQASEITANTAKISYTDASAVAANTAKISYTDAAAVSANTAKVSYTDAAIVATAIQPADTVADLAPIPATTQSGTTYTLGLSDEFSMVLLSNAALVTVTVPTNASVALPVGTQIALQSTGAGGVTLTTTSLTLNGSSPNTTIAQNEVMVLEKTGTDTWSVLGGTSA